MSSHRQQAQLDAPLGEVWALIGNPKRYPEWWPKVVEVRGERFEEGEEYVQVTQDPRRRIESSLREIRMSCQLTGAYAHWLVTESQGGTFVDLEMGMQPKRLGDRLFDATVGRRYFRGWSERSLEGLREATKRARERRVATADRSGTARP